MDLHLSKVIDFLNQIGLKTTLVENINGFVNHCRIIEGTLEVDARCRASGLLHEAGHLAPLPAQYRCLFSGNVSRGQKAMLDAITELNLHPDHPLYRAAIQSSEAEATSWAWAAGKHLGIPDELIIQDDEYNGDGEVERLRLQFGRHYGINGLHHAGFCKVSASSPKPLPVYPSLAFWLQPHIDPTMDIAGV